MAYELTEAFVNLDIRKDNFTENVIDAFEGSDLRGGDCVNAEGAKELQGTHGWTYDNQTLANENGCIVTRDGNAVKVDGSAFLYVSDQFSQGVTNEATGLSQTANISKMLHNAVKQNIR